MAMPWLCFSQAPQADLDKGKDSEVTEDQLATCSTTCGQGDPVTTRETMGEYGKTIDKYRELGGYIGKLCGSTMVFRYSVNFSIVQLYIVKIC